MAEVVLRRIDIVPRQSGRTISNTGTWAGNKEPKHFDWEEQGRRSKVLGGSFSRLCRSQAPALAAVVRPEQAPRHSDLVSAVSLPFFVVSRAVQLGRLGLDGEGGLVEKLLQHGKHCSTYLLMWSSI